MNTIFSSDLEELAKQIFGPGKVWEHDKLTDYIEAASSSHNAGKIDLLQVIFTDYFGRI